MKKCALIFHRYNWLFWIIWHAMSHFVQLAGYPRTESLKIAMFFSIFAGYPQSPDTLDVQPDTLDSKPYTLDCWPCALDALPHTPDFPPDSLGSSWKPSGNFALELAGYPPSHFLFEN